MALNGMNMAQKTSKQDYMNLLYSDSESDTIPDLKLPPLKGRKQKRKKVHGGRSDDSSCSGWAALKIIVSFIVLATLVALAGLSFWTVQRIHELQNEIQNCE